MPDVVPAEHLNLPAASGGGEVEAIPGAEVAEVVDAEVVEAPEPPRPVYTATVLGVARSARSAAGHPGTRAVARHASYVAAGLVVTARRRRRRRSLPAEMAHLAAARGDHAAAKEWAELEHRHRQERAQRRRDSAELAARLFILLPKIIAGALVVMVAASVLMAMRGGVHGFEAPWRFAAAVVSAGYTGATLTWDALPYTLPAGVLTWLWHVGRTAGAMSPGWTIGAKADKEERGLVVTADGIAVALQHTPVSELKKAFTKGWQPTFHTTPVRDGEGYFAVFSLPMGVTASMIADQVEIFARNLHRAKTEVWVTDAERAKVAPAGFVSLWVANPGVLDRPAPEYPLLHEGEADVFQGVPGGVTARGDQVLMPVVANNLVAGGQMGQGKSNALRVYALGCALDPLCQVNVFVFAGNGDFDSFAPRLATYVKGAQDSTVAAALMHLQYLLEEVGKRETRLAELGAKKLTRHIAEKHADMRPVVSMFSECHELFGDKELGELAAELAVKIIKRARKTGITLCFDTQSSRAGAIPSELVELVSVNCCFYVKTWRSNDGFLGDGCFQCGIRATELRPGRDIGRSLVTGVSDAQFELLKWHYIFSNDDTGEDDAKPAIERSLRQLAPGTRVTGGDGAALPAAGPRDLLQDLAEVIGPDRVRIADLPARLRKMAPAWAPYRGLDGTRLARLLDDAGVKWVRPGNVPQLDPAELHAVLGRREPAGVS